MTILRESDNFKLYEVSGQVWLRTKLKNVEPTGRRLRQSDVRYLVHETGQSFDFACLLDYGLAVFQKRRNWKPRVYA